MFLICVNIEMITEIVLQKIKHHFEIKVTQPKYLIIKDTYENLRFNIMHYFLK